jgi:hypothetical protein
MPHLIHTAVDPSPAVTTTTGLVEDFTVAASALAGTTAAVSAVVGFIAVGSAAGESMPAASAEDSMVAVADSMAVAAIASLQASGRPVLHRCRSQFAMLAGDVLSEGILI